jgi:dihydrofolate synthase/folylpolyglutamate synthase
MNKFNNVSELVNFIENQRRIDPKVNLDKMRGFCKVLGNPEKTFKSIHVTGTNGKGSVVSYLKSIFTILS